MTLRSSLYLVVILSFAFAFNLSGMAAELTVIYDLIAASVLLFVIITCSPFVDKMLFTVSLMTYKRLLQFGLLEEVLSPER